MHLVQLLPVNDTSVYNMWWDSYPYSTVSVFALHPLYLSIRAIRPDLPPDLRAEVRTLLASITLPVKPRSELSAR